MEHAQHALTAGLAFLRALDELSFGAADVPDDTVFVDELDLPRRNEDEPGCAPDYGVLVDGPAVDHRAQDGAGERPERAGGELLRARPAPLPRAADRPHVPDAGDGRRGRRGAGGSRLAQVTWEQVMPLIDAAWSGATGSTRPLHDALVEAVASIGSSWTVWREKTLNDLTAKAARMARLTAQDGRSGRSTTRPVRWGSCRSCGSPYGTSSGARRSPLGAVTPWLWDAATSGGQALTEAGRVHGYELRFSREGSSVWLRIRRRGGSRFEGWPCSRR